MPLPGEAPSQLASLLASKFNVPVPLLLTVTFDDGFVALPAVPLSVTAVEDTDNVGGGGGGETLKVTVTVAGEP